MATELMLTPVKSSFTWRLIRVSLGTPVALVLAAGIGGGGAASGSGSRDATRCEARMLAQATRNMVALERHVSYLSSIATIATLLGLLGTVGGMIVSFMNMRASGVSDPTVLAGGISQALITTAAGLSVAIPSLLAYHIFVQITGKAASRMEIAAAELMAYYAGRVQAVSGSARGSRKATTGTGRARAAADAVQRGRSAGTKASTARGTTSRPASRTAS